MYPGLEVLGAARKHYSRIDLDACELADRDTEAVARGKVAAASVWSPPGALRDTPPRLQGIHHPSAAGQDPLAPRRLGSARKSSRPVALLYPTTLVCATLAGQEQRDGARTGPLALEADVPWLKAQRS